MVVAISQVMENNSAQTKIRTSYNYTESAPISVKRTIQPVSSRSTSVLDAMLSAQLTEAKMKQCGMYRRTSLLGFLGDVVRRYVVVILAVTIIGTAVAVRFM